MNQQQARILKERLSKARSAHDTYSSKHMIEPATVTKARAVVKAWGEKVSEGRDLRKKKIDDACAVVEEAIYFGDANAALAALKKFEAMKF